VRFIRSNHSWQIVGSFSGVDCCLEILALENRYRVSAICAVLGCSRRCFYAVFLRDIGLAPKQWMNLERMVVARRKLEGGRHLHQVAQDLGFASVQSFGGVFYRTYGVYPSRFISNRKIFDPSCPVV
jgi:AraC-like DNA-binding protein